MLTDQEMTQLLKSYIPHLETLNISHDDKKYCLSVVTHQRILWFMVCQFAYAEGETLSEAVCRLLIKLKVKNKEGEA